MMILVIGGTGNIGSEVVRLLGETDCEFRVLARDKPKAQAMLGSAGVVVEGDLSKPDTVMDAMRGVDKLFLVTPLHLNQIAMKSTAIQAAKRAGVGRIVMSTGAGAGPDAGIEIGRWHGVSQEEVKETGIPCTFLQPGFFMQNFLMFAGPIRSAGEFYLPLGDSRVSFVDARDIAAVGVAALTGDGHENRSYTITGPEALTCAEAAGILSDTTGRPIRFVDVPPEAAGEGMIGAGMPRKLADLILELYALGPAGHLAHVSDTVERTTGKKARSFRQFAQDHAAAFRA
jgi:uncharacterized protein YbjT (DUF2867 family)